MLERPEAFEEFVAHLAMIFKKHFRMNPTVLGPSGEENTPFLAFVTAVCAEQDIVHPTLAEISDIGRRRGIPEDV